MARTRRDVGVPGWIYLPAVAGAAFVLLPLVAIVSRVEGERRRIYTARYALTIKGRQRGAFEWGMDEVGSGPLEALEELLALEVEEVRLLARRRVDVHGRHVPCAVRRRGGRE